MNIWNINQVIQKQLWWFLNSVQRECLLNHFVTMAIQDETCKALRILVERSRDDGRKVNGIGKSAYNFNFVRLQWRLLALYLILLPVRILIHWGIGRFCFNFFANFCLILNVLWDDIFNPKTKNLNISFQHLNDVQRAGARLVLICCFSFAMWK